MKINFLILLISLFVIGCIANKPIYIVNELNSDVYLIKNEIMDTIKLKPQEKMEFAVFLYNKNNYPVHSAELNYQLIPSYIYLINKNKIYMDKSNMIEYLESNRTRNSKDPILFPITDSLFQEYKEDK